MEIDWAGWAMFAALLVVVLRGIALEHDMKQTMASLLVCLAAISAIMHHLNLPESGDE